MSRRLEEGTLVKLLEVMLDGEIHTHTHTHTHRCLCLAKCRQYLELLCFCMMLIRTRYYKYVSTCISRNGVYML
jgi:hypothetical protein